MAGPIKLALALALYAGAVAILLAFAFNPWLLLAAGALPLLGLVLMGVLDGRSAAHEADGLRQRLAQEQARSQTLSLGLDRAESRLQALDEPVLVIDHDGRVASCNPAAEQLLELRADRLVGRPVEEAFTRADLLGLYERARAGEDIRERVRVARADGARVWDVSAIPLRDALGSPAGVLMCPRDATDAALALRVRADFVANASHELRTPIAAMRIALDTMGALEPGDEAMRARLDEVFASNVARLEEMARDLLDLSRLESDDGAADAAPLSLSDLTRELRATFGPACTARRLTLTFDTAPGVERLRSDRRLLTLILGNLIDNAAKFAFEGTQIRITARALQPEGLAVSSRGLSESSSATPGTRAAEPAPRRGARDAAPPPAPTSDAPNPPPSTRSESASRSIRLEISDRGVGIPLDQQPRIFERYYQVDAARSPGQPRRGTGLGLAIVKHAVRNLGGTIRVQSVWQQGTTMIVELPDCVEP